MRELQNEALALGKAEGEAKNVLAVLRARGTNVPETDRMRIVHCRCDELRRRWVERAATANAIGQPLDED